MKNILHHNMNTIPSIKQIFGNHNMVRQYLDFITNSDDTIPPFKPVLYRAIACGGINDTDALIKNQVSLHKAINRIVMNELLDLYNRYQQIFLQNME